MDIEIIKRNAKEFLIKLWKKTREDINRENKKNDSYLVEQIFINDENISLLHDCWTDYEIFFEYRDSYYRDYNDIDFSDMKKIVTPKTPWSPNCYEKVEIIALRIPVIFTKNYMFSQIEDKILTFLAIVRNKDIIKFINKDISRMIATYMINWNKISLFNGESFLKYKTFRGHHNTLEENFFLYIIENLTRICFDNYIEKEEICIDL